MILKWRCKFRYQRIREKIVSHCFGEGELSLGAHFSPGSQTFEYELELPPKLSRGIMTNRTLKKLRSNENFLNRLSLIQFSERFLGPKRQLSSHAIVSQHFGNRRHLGILSAVHVSCQQKWIILITMSRSSKIVVLIKVLYLIIWRIMFRWRKERKERVRNAIDIYYNFSWHQTWIVLLSN